jgi:DNA repair exonuclease SbcCD ATPase subunit
MEQQAQQRLLQAAIQMAEALYRQASQWVYHLEFGDLAGAGKQFNELVQWLQQELGIRLPFPPLPEDVDPRSLTLAAAQLVAALRGIAGEVMPEEPTAERQKREREPILRIREQKSPVEFTELVVTSAEQLAELLRTNLPDWIKTVVAKATQAAERATAEAMKVADQAVAEAMKVAEQAAAEATAKQAGGETVRIGAGRPTSERLSERLEEVAELLEEIADELEDVEEELADAAEEGRLTDALKARLMEKRARLLAQVQELMERRAELLTRVREMLQRLGQESESGEAQCG